MNFLTAGFPLGRIFRIQVIVSWAFILFAAWLILGSHSPLSQAIFLAALFGVVLLHEFGHALVCRAVGGRADHIILWPLGGLAIVEPPPKWWAWLLTTIGGPAVNAVLAPLCWLVMNYVTWWLPDGSSLQFWVFMVAKIGLDINLLLLAFNLIPVFPLDGGRILQSILWPMLGYARSLLVAAAIGTVGGVALLVLGLGFFRIRFNVPMYGPYVLGGDYSQGDTQMMVAFIGLFVAFTSFQQYRYAEHLLGARR